MLYRILRSLVIGLAILVLASVISGWLISTYIGPFIAKAILWFFPS